MPTVSRIPLDAFAAIGDELSSGDDHPAAPRAAQAHRLLDPDHPTRRQCEVELFGIEGVGRVAAIINPRLAGDDHRPIGQLGLFACRDDLAAAQQLLDAGAAWLRERGCAIARGPMCFSTWHDYRFVVRQNYPGWIPGEPYHPGYYPKLWLEAGFERAATYTSNFLGPPRPLVEKYAAMSAPALADGYSIRSLVPDDLPKLFRLAHDVFSEAWMYSPIEPEEFAALYGADQVDRGARVSYIVHSPQGEPVGFFYAFPVQLGDRLTNVCKTIAIAPAHRARRVYHLMLTTWLGDGVADGFEHFAGALMHVDGGAAKLGYMEPDQQIKEYALYERRL